MMLNFIASALLAITAPAIDAQQTDSAYAIVVSQDTHRNPLWREVVEALVQKHDGVVITYESNVESTLSDLRRVFPKHTCFVTAPSEASREFVASVHQLTRKLDDDPYADTLWGILTGYDSRDALRIAKHAEPLTIRKAASGTEIAMEMVDEGVWYCELTPQRMVEKKTGGEAKQKEGPLDSTKALVDSLNQYKADLFVTSGHATERDWQIGFRYKNGTFQSRGGQLFGVDTGDEIHAINSPNPKVYLPIGNCLMGHIDGPDAMALAWMHSAGVHQMIGYTVPTWFGYGGWGCLDYFVEQPGRYTFAEAFVANHHALIHRLQQQSDDQRGMKFDRDVVAFYGDPAWQAMMADRPKAYQQKLSVEEGSFTFEITGNRGDKSFHPVNTNGAQRGWRPIVQFLPHRVQDVVITSGMELNPVITDDFLLIPNPRQYDASRQYVVKFHAKPIKR